MMELPSGRLGEPWYRHSGFRLAAGLDEPLDLSTVSEPGSSR